MIIGEQIPLNGGAPRWGARSTLGHAHAPGHVHRATGLFDPFPEGNGHFRAFAAHREIGSVVNEFQLQPVRHGGELDRDRFGLGMTNGIGNRLAHQLVRVEAKPCRDHQFGRPRRESAIDIPLSRQPVGHPWKSFANH